MAENKEENQKSERALKEEKILEFWKENDIFHKSLEKESPKGEFVFYEGPPTANGHPAIHHLEARSFKDAIPRYKTMQGFHVRRKAGWDTHGLPVEIEAEKTLGLKSKKEIESYGIEKFNAECKRSVGMYIDEWSKFTDRIGYWADLDDAYFTYDNSFIESVWSIVGHVEKRKLLYKDYKVVPWCPRCGTALSSHELAQGYKDVKDLSLYVKFKIVGFPEAYFLAWTTTPWTLPGNVALAVGSDIDYVEAKVGNEILVLAKSKLSLLTEPYEVVAEHKGKEMAGMEYEPLYTFAQDLALESEKPKFDKAYKVYIADFVTTEDGTGIVHTAVMYGQEDFDLGTKIGLPKVHVVSPDATFVPGTDWLEGRSVLDDDLAVDILKDLKERGLLFNKENYAHSYPFCWRCKTRLIYYARDSWYIRMSELRDDLIKENERINWEPEYIKGGRFGEWLREVKDWAISRERYWGTPLPIWQTEDGGERMVVDSMDTLKEYTEKSGNKYFVMRHGGTEGNKKEIVSYKKQAEDHLTEEGKAQSIRSISEFKEGEKAKIDLIFTSPFARTRETAELAANDLGLSKEEIIEDSRLVEVNPGEFDDKNWKEYHETMYSLGTDWFSHTMPGGESMKDVLRRMGNFIYEIEEKYKGKNILIVTHGGPAWILYVASGLYTPEKKRYEIPHTQAFVNDFKRFENAEIRRLDFVPLPHTQDYIVDFHKPYIDEVVLVKNGQKMKRVKEVMDVWFDSGSVPFAQDAGDRERPGDFSQILYPADFISEAIDQTRGWFYTLHAIGVLMERGLAYKNVICLGHLLDKDGKKMSKSIGNVINPWEAMDKYGVDTLRLWMYSINQAGESKRFDERSVDEVQKRVFNLLDNVFTFYELYRDKSLEENKQPDSSNILDQWILERLSELNQEMTSKLDSYRLLEPTRSLRDFIDDLSTWFVRRSRERLKTGDKEAKQTLYFVLKTVSKLLAPLAPFAAEDLYQKLRIENDPLSVHLESWPLLRSGSVRQAGDIIKDMQEVRRLVSLALEARSKTGMKIRQPLSELRIKNNELKEGFKEIIGDELNVKAVISDESLSEDISLNTELTPELIEEGKMRDIIRGLQDLRKEKNLVPDDVMEYEVPAEDREIFEKFRDEIIKTTNIRF